MKHRVLSQQLPPRKRQVQKTMKIKKRMRTTALLLQLLQQQLHQRIFGERCPIFFMDPILKKPAPPTHHQKHLLQMTMMMMMILMKRPAQQQQRQNLIHLRYPNRVRVNPPPPLPRTILLHQHPKAKSLKNPLLQRSKVAAANLQMMMMNRSLAQ